MPFRPFTLLHDLLPHNIVQQHNVPHLLSRLCCSGGLGEVVLLGLMWHHSHHVAHMQLSLSPAASCQELGNSTKAAENSTKGKEEVPFVTSCCAEKRFLTLCHI